MSLRTGILLSTLIIGCGPSTGSTGTDPSDSSGGSMGPSSTGMSSVSSTSATSPVPTTGGPADSTDTGSNFIDPSPGCEESGEGGPSSECSVWAQDCCEGDKCVAWANDGGVAVNATRCVEIDPRGGAPGDPCTVMDSPVSGVDDCDATSYCFGADPVTLMGECVELCQGSSDAPVCPEGVGCFIANDEVLNLCLDLCDPLADECGPGEACQWFSDELLLCFPEPMGKFGPGDPCEANWGCAPADHCVDAGSYPGCGGAVGCCSPYCDRLDPDGNAPCVAIDPAMSCVSVFEGDPRAGLEHLGVCSLP